MHSLTPRRILGICALLGAVLFIAVVISLRLGAYPMSFRAILESLYQSAMGRGDQIPSDYRLVIFGLRLPRIAFGIIVGAALAVSGAGFQALLRNPLADPYVLGVSSGAAVGAIVALIFAPHIPLVMEGAAFAGAGLTIAAVYFLGRRGGQIDTTTLLLAGIISASFLSAIISFLDNYSERARFARHVVLADGRSGDTAANRARAFVVCDAGGDRRNLYDRVRSEFDFDGRTGSAASGR